MVSIDSILGPALLIGIGLVVLWARGSEEPAIRQQVGSQEVSVSGLLQAGRKIEAIKLYRRLHGVGLREAKDAVEALAQGLPQ